MSPLDVADNKGADTERASPAYVPPLRLVASDLIGEDVIRLTYVPA